MGLIPTLYLPHRRSDIVSAPRLRKVATRREFDSVLDDYCTQGYETLSLGENSALLRKKTWGSGSGHVLCALFTIWFTAGTTSAPCSSRSRCAGWKLDTPIARTLPSR